jgi:alginate O-acetyltransferase complex protein AlgI
VDTYRRQVSDHDPLRYALFVTYFPHLIAGPIIHHRPVMRQLADPTIARLSAENWLIGLTFFSIGLAKKLLLADPLGGIASPLFATAPASGLSMVASWVAAGTYTFQLYFDFSGYSDMAVGLSLLFGVHIPINFLSPYKAGNIIEFWRTWHISLSTFLKDYLYIALGGNRRGTPRRYLNLFATMVLGGLWHGAGWNYVAWGALHGLYLLVNHWWRELPFRFGARWQPC